MYFIMLSIALGSAPADPASALPSLDKDAALVCATATKLASRGGPSLHSTLQASQYLMIAAKASPGADHLIDRVIKLAPEFLKTPVAPETVPKLLTQCDRRFPSVRSNAAVTLPVDPFERDTACLATLVFLKSMIRVVSNPGNDTLIVRIRALMGQLSLRLPHSVFVQHNVNTQKDFDELMDTRTDRVLQSSPEQFAKACGLTEL